MAKEKQTKKNTEKKEDVVIPSENKKEKKKKNLVETFNIHELKDYYNVCEILLKHYEKQVFANEKVSQNAYSEAKAIYDRYNKIHNIIFAEMEKRIVRIDGDNI